MNKKTKQYYKHWEKNKAYRKEAQGRNKAKRLCFCCTRKQLWDYYRGCPNGWEVDHIVPLFENGFHCLDNLQYLSRKDHESKSWKERRVVRDLKGRFKRRRVE